MAVTNSSGDVGRHYGVIPFEDIPGGGGPAPANNLIYESAAAVALESTQNLDLES